MHMTGTGYAILGGLVALILAWLHGRSSGKNAEIVRQSDEALKQVKQKIAGESNVDVAADLEGKAK